MGHYSEQREAEEERQRLRREGEDFFKSNKDLLKLDWYPSPVKTVFGKGMVCATVALSRDETLTLYTHKSAIHLVPAALQHITQKG